MGRAVSRCVRIGWRIEPRILTWSQKVSIEFSILLLRVLYKLINQQFRLWLMRKYGTLVLLAIWLLCDDLPANSYSAPRRRLAVPVHVPTCNRIHLIVDLATYRSVLYFDSWHDALITNGIQCPIGAPTCCLGTCTNLNITGSSCGTCGLIVWTPNLSSSYPF